ncbi:MAG TPA: sensor protein (modular protein), partial [Cyanobacteria bacterium UBA11148]|nr:sensor protein (modular protein) [Cyanobacteria bacterium UBA11148]
MQEQLWQRQEAEKQLQKTKENLAEQVKQQTLELSQANAQLKQEIQDRIAAEIEVRRLNAELEQRVQERTAQLAASNQELQQTLAHLQATQQELIQSEKMAALGQLIAGVAHEINTPLGAIRSSVENIADFLTKKLDQLPLFFQELSPELQQKFFALLQNSTQPSTPFSAKEKRQFKRALIGQLQNESIPNADTIADTLVDLGIYEDISPFLPLLQAPESQTILNTAYQLASV